MFKTDIDLNIASFFIARGHPPERFIDMTNEEVIFYSYVIKQYYDIELAKMEYWSNYFAKLFGAKRK